MDQNNPDDSTGSEDAPLETGVVRETDVDVESGETERETTVESDVETTNSGEHANTNTPDDPSPSSRREVIVPLRLYKTITVFSTLIAISGILVGFILLDVATNRTQADLSEVNILVAVLGIGLIAGGAITYAFSTRFRTAGMGNAKDDADEHSDTDNG